MGFGQRKSKTLDRVLRSRFGLGASKPGGSRSRREMGNWGEGGGRVFSMMPKMNTSRFTRGKGGGGGKQ